MNMTHYMELLAVNQPWNLIIFMAIPVILAETLAITELCILFRQKMVGRIYTLNRLAGILAGFYFLGVLVYLVFTAVIPITSAGQWRTIIDVIAVFSYLFAGLPLIYIAFQEIGILNRSVSQHKKLKFHVIAVSLFLVFAHIAMIAGMMDPGLLGYVPAVTEGMHMQH